MKTAKIEQILETRERAWSKFWQMFFIKMKLDNWETITLMKKKADAFKTGDSVNYEEYTDDNWKQKWKEIKENWFKKGDYKQDQRGYFTSISFQIAFQSYSWEDSYKYCSDLARRIFADMLDNYENKQPEENDNTNKNIESPNEVKKEVEEDLPF